MLILAGVSISMLSGENGVITQAQKSTIKNDNGTVLEALRLKLTEYLTNNNGKYVGDKIMLLKDEGIINDNKIINVPNLIGEKLKTGNGAEGKDVYTIEDNHLYYYDKNGEKTDLGDLGDLGSLVIETDESYFEISDDGTISLKDYENYYSTVTLGDSKWPHVIENLVIPRQINGITVTKIADGFCTHYQHVKTVYIPDTVISIGRDAFNQCRNLLEVRMSNNTTNIEDFAFLGCNALRSITIPEKVTSIEQGAFQYCGLLNSIIIPESVTRIGARAFGSCTNLKSAIISSTAITMDYPSYSSVFYSCDNLTTITVIRENGETLAGEPWGAENATISYVDKNYQEFAQNYLANKNQQDLEKYILKSMTYPGTFEEFLAEDGLTREQIEQMASDKGLTYSEYLENILIYEIGDNSWIKIEYELYKNYGTIEGIEDLEEMFLEKYGKEFDQFLKENGMTREEFENTIKEQTGWSLEDALKVFLIEEIM